MLAQVQRDERRADGLQLNDLGVVDLPGKQRDAIVAEEQDRRGERDRDDREQHQREPAEQRAREQRHAGGTFRRAGRGLVVRHEHVAEPPHRLDVAGVRGIGFDQLAQPRHLHVDRPVEHVVVAPARQEGQLLARERLPRMLDEDLHQRELAGREMDRRVAAGQRPCREIQRERPEGDLALGRRRTGSPPIGLAAQDGMDARDELARIERLRQVVVGTHLEPDDAVDLFALRGQHDDRDALARAAYPPADREAVLARQHQVEHDEVRGVALQLPVEIARVRKYGDLEALLGQVARQEVPQAHVVVDDEDLGRGDLRGHGQD